MKPIKYIFYITFALLALSQNTCRADELDDFQEMGLDEFAFGIEDVHHEPMIMRGAGFDAFDIVHDFNTPTPQVGLIVSNPFYSFTKPIRRRSLLDCGNFQFPNLNTVDPSFLLYPFYNQTSRAVYTESKTGIASYVDLEQAPLLDLINTNFPGSVNVPELLSLFKNIKVQERRLGFMFQYNHPFSDCLLSFHLPLLYQEHNFYLTPAEQKAIKNSPYLQGGPPIDIIQFAHDHLISDKIGISDLRIGLEKIVYEIPYCYTNLGCDFTIPTAFAFKKGVYGSYFDKKKPRPNFDLYTDILLPLDNNAFATVKTNSINISLATLDRVSTLLIENPLGNNGHFGIAPFIRNTLIFSPSVSMTSKTKIEFLLPAKERRFFRQNITLQEVNAIVDLTVVDADDNAGTAQLQLLTDLFLDNLFPKSYEATLFPGVLFESYSKITYARNNWEYSIGSEFFYQTKEVIFDVDAPSIEKIKLDIQGAAHSYAVQSKMWLSIEKIKKENSNWHIGVTLASTGILSHGIGADCSLMISCAREF